jgi:hypothetical protein
MINHKRIRAALVSLRTTLQELEGILDGNTTVIDASRIDSDVLEAIRQIGGKMSLVTIREEMEEKYSVPQTRRSLKRLRTEGAIFREGKTKSATYCVAKAQHDV